MHSRVNPWGRVSLLVAALLLVGCDSSSTPPDAGTQVDAGSTVDAGVTEDAGMADSGVAEALPCERTQGVCAGALRALVDGAYEPVCTAHSYGADYEASETRCDGLDNDCDGLTDPTTWTDVAPLGSPPYKSIVDSLPVAGGFLVASHDKPLGIQMRLLGESLTLQAHTAVSVESSFSPVTGLQLVRTARGPALFYVSQKYSSELNAQGRLVPLDEQGHPAGSQEGIVLFEQPQSYAPSRVASSVDGQRLAVVWRDGTTQGREVRGVVVNADGEALTGSRSLFVAEEQVYLYTPAVLGLGDGGFLVMAVEDHGVDAQSRIRLWHYDQDLSVVIEERVLDVGYSPTAMVLNAAPAAGSSAGEPLLLYRETSVRPAQLKQVRSLFAGGVPETLASTTEGDTPWFGATMTSSGLQVAWNSMHYVWPEKTADYLFNWEGQFWGMGPNKIATDWSPGFAPMPLHRNGEWVLMHELPGHWTGALLMTATNVPSETFTLRSVRYCAP